MRREEKNGEKKSILRDCVYSLNCIEFPFFPFSFIENEKNSNANEPWSKLDKTAKIKKLSIFAENYKTDHNLSDEEFAKLTNFLKDCLDRKKLQRVKDVTYDKVNGEVKDIPALHHNKQSNHFTLKNTDKHISTTRSLAPKKARGTAKNVVNYDSDTSI